MIHQEHIALSEGSGPQCPQRFTPGLYWQSKQKAILGRCPVQNGGIFLPILLAVISLEVSAEAVALWSLVKPVPRLRGGEKNAVGTLSKPAVC